MGLVILLIKVILDFRGLLKLISDKYESLLEIGDVAGIVKDVFTRYTQHAMPTREKQPSRSVEMNVVLFNGIADQPESGVVRQLREKLWAEHLGLSALPPDLQNIPTDASTMKWVEFWNDVAQANKVAMQKGTDPAADHAPHILAWTGDDDHKHYLKELKISTKNLRDVGDNYDFNECKLVVKHWLLKWLPI